MYLYLGALRTLGTRNIYDYLTLAHTAVDVINVGSAELLWGRLFPGQRVWAISSFDQPGHFLALTPVLLLSCAASAAYWWEEALSSTNPLLRSLILGTVAAIGLVFLLTLKQGDVTPFEFVRWIVPGAGAIWVGMRGQIIASALAAVVVTASAAHIFDSTRARFARAIVWVVFGLIVAEQINMIDVHLRQHDFTFGNDGVNANATHRLQGCIFHWLAADADRRPVRGRRARHLGIQCHVARAGDQQADNQRHVGLVSARVDPDGSRRHSRRGSGS